MYVEVEVDDLKFLNDHAWLVVKKNGHWVEQYCPFAPTNNGLVHCGLHCPLCAKFYPDDPDCQRGVMVCQNRLLVNKHLKEGTKCLH